VESEEEGPLKIYAVEHRDGVVAIRLARQSEHGLELVAAGDRGSILLTPDEASALSSELDWHQANARS
jgi:hypothetical protein